MDRSALARAALIGLLASCTGDAGPDAPAPSAPPQPSCDAPPPPSATWSVTDGVVCRPLADAGVTLVDWDGHLGNPAITVRVTPPAGVTFPTVATISSDEPRVYFDARPTRARGETFPPVVRTITFSDATPVEVTIAIWPDRDGEAEEHALRIEGGGASATIPIHVVDQDLATPITYPVVVDFSKDALFPDGTRVLDDPTMRAVVTQAADDWAYFFDGRALDDVAAGKETTTVDESDGWYGKRPTTANAAAYKGFLLYATGIHTKEDRSTGYPTFFPGFESEGGKPLPGKLHRSGALEIERLGNYGELGWFVSTSDDDWYERDNLADVANDLASIVHHEVGHALFFDEGYQRFVPAKPAASGPDTPGKLSSPEITAYYGKDLAIDRRNHFSSGTDPNVGPVEGAIDPASGLGAFGNEYADTGVMPRRRWIITKLDLLAAKAIGYPLREEISPFVALAIGDAPLADASVGQPYAGALVATGGVPAYAWLVTGGALPPGLALDSFTGAIAGTPRAQGTFAFTVVLRDALGATTASKDVSIAVR